MKISVFYVIPAVIDKINYSYLNIIGHSHIPLICSVTTTAIHPLISWIFITYLNLDTLGCGIAMLITSTIIATLSQLYIHFANPLPQSYFQINSDCFRGWDEYLSVPIPSAFVFCAEWWAFEIQTIVAVTISKLDYAVYVLTGNIYLILFSISLGFSISTTILSGKYITEYGSKETKKLFYIIMIFGSVVSFLASLIILLFGRNIFSLFIESHLNKDIIEKGTPIVYVIVILQIFDLAQNVFAGFYRGIGKQFLAMSISLVNFYIVQLGLSILLAIKFQLGVIGIYLGILIGTVIAVATYAIVLTCLDLEEIRQDILSKLQGDLNSIKECSIAQKNGPEIEVDYVLKKEEQNVHVDDDRESLIRN